jgi:hypothetical protein
MLRRHGPARSAAGFGLLATAFYLLVAITQMDRAPVLADAANALADLSQRRAARGHGMGLPVQIVAIDDRTWASFAEVAAGRIPAATPATALARIIERARYYKVPLLVVDLDIAPQRPAAEEAELGRALAHWAQDEHAGALILARRPSEGPTRTPFDSVIRDARNILWGSVQVERDDRDVARWIYPELADPAGRWPHVAVAGAAIWRAATPAPDRRKAAAARAAALKACLARKGPLHVCLGTSPSATRAAIAIPFHAGMPTIADLEAAGGDAPVNGVSVRAAADFIAFPVLDDLSGTAMFVGVTHRNGGDRMMTPLGRQNGVFVVAAATATWAKTGFPQPPSRLLGAVVAASWGAAVGAGLGWAAAVRRRRGPRSAPPSPRWRRPLLNPLYIGPAVIGGVDVLFFLLLSALPYNLVDWSAMSLAALALSIAAAFGSVLATMKEVRR